jgi:carboxypeptidase C (cathepsin A)
LYDDEGFMLQPPFRAVDNEHTILDLADIVYIDPMATGYSRMLPGEDLHKYHGTREDLDSVAEFIRLYVTRAKRWDSPKFLIGESYGTTRAAGLASVLQTRHKMYLNGIVLVSCMSLGVQTGGDLGVMTTVPHLTATAWYHKRLPADLQAKPIRAVLDEAERFATTEFIAALVRGNTLTAAEKAEIAKKLARYTGLSPEYLLRANLRVDRGRFRKELLRSEGLTVGRLDTRYKGVDRDRNGLTNEYDPAMEAWNGPFTAVVNKYLREELGVETDLSYAIAGDVSPWKSDATVNVGQMLQEATSQNPFLRVLVLEGYYDGATDAFGAQYAFSHIDANGDWKDRLTFAFYECGHMMYIRKADLAKAKKDIADFVRSALPK